MNEEEIESRLNIVTKRIKELEGAGLSKRLQYELDMLTMLKYDLILLKYKKINENKKTERET